MSSQPFLGLTLLSGTNRMYLEPGAVDHVQYPTQPSGHRCHSESVPGHHTPPDSTSTNRGSAKTRRPASGSTTGTLARSQALRSETYEALIRLIERGKL